MNNKLIINKEQEIGNIDTYIDIMPAFESNEITLCTSSSNFYVPYLSVFLESIKKHASKDNCYDIIIFEHDITTENKNLLYKRIKSNNVSLRFVNPMFIIEKYDLSISAWYSIECYFRLTAPLILKNFDKIIFTDVDLIFEKDPAELYNINIDGYPLAACSDLMMDLMINIKDDNDWFGYLKNVLKLDDPYKYFNTGVMILNLKEFNKNNYTLKLLELVSKIKFRILEQDALNYFFKTNIKYIDTSWNFPILHRGFKQVIDLMPENSLAQYKNDKKDPKIIHYAGYFKPWIFVDEDLADVWWKYARNTIFYEKILVNLWDNNFKNYCTSLKSMRISPCNNFNYKLFGFISLLKIKRKNNKLKLKVLGIPVLKIKNKNNQKYKFYLFNVVPFLKIKKSNNKISTYLFNFIPILKINKR